MRLPFCLLALAIRAGDPALAAVDLPVRGTFGSDPSDCQAAKDESEGGYVFFDADGTTGEGGQGGCDFTGVKQVKPGRYELVGLCYGLETKKKRTRRILVVVGPDEIVYDDTPYRRCPDAK